MGIQSTRSDGDRKEGYGNIPRPTAERLQVSDLPKEERGQRQDAFRRALVRGEPAIKGMTIYANPGSDDNLALVRFSQVPFENRHQFIWACHFGCSY